MTSAEWEAICLSLQVGLVAVAASLPFGIAAGWLLARKRFWGETIAETLISLPLVLPPVVTGYLLLILLGRRSTVGGFLYETFGIEFIFDWKGAALASAVVSFPLMVRSIKQAFSSGSADLEIAARTLGAGRIRVFFTISLPLATSGVIAGAVLAFARCIGEFGATIMLAGNIEGRTQTIPLFIYTQLNTPDGIERSWGVLLVSILMSAVALWIGNWMEQRAPSKTT